MNKTKKMLSFGLAMLMIFSMFSAFSINASAATTSTKNVLIIFLPVEMPEKRHDI